MSRARRIVCCKGKAYKLEFVWRTLSILRKWIGCGSRKKETRDIEIGLKQGGNIAVLTLPYLKYQL